MFNANIRFSIELNEGKFKGSLVFIDTDIEELEEEDLSTLLIQKKYLKSWSNNGEYTVVNRTITVIDEV